MQRQSTNTQAETAAAFAQIIKTATAGAHASLEANALLTALMSPAVSIAHYAAYLSIMQQLELTYEQKILPVLASTFPLQLKAKASGLIADDLNYINPLSSQLFVPSGYVLPAAELTMPLALGFAYVMEGSRLGGRMIYKHIKRALGMTEMGGAKFIAGNNEETVAIWRAFISTLATFAAENNCQENTVLAANVTFSSFDDYFEVNRIAYGV